MKSLRNPLAQPLVVLALVFIVLPVLMTLAGSTISLATQVVIYALYGIAYNLLLGYTGMVSFGSSMFFGMASYASALFSLHVTQNVVLALIVGMVFAALLGLLVGALILRRRGLYFALLTLAFTQLFFEICFRWTSFTGGENGLQGVLRPGLEGAVNYYVFCAVIVLVCAWLLQRIVHSPFGRVLQAIRDNEKRVQYLGYDPWGYKLCAIVLHAAFIGLGGGMLSLLIHGAYADNLNWQHAGDPVMMTLLGGIHHFLGPLWGAIIYINLSDQLSAYTEHWWLIFGALIIAVVLLSPEGLSGFYARLRGHGRWSLTCTPAPQMPASVVDPFAVKGRAERHTILEVSHLSKRFGHVVTADDISLTVSAGSVHSLIGPNGAGKTTLFNMLTGLIPHDAGSIKFNGREISKLKIHERTRLGMSRSFQVVSLPENLTVLEAVRVAAQAESPQHASLWRNAYDLPEPLERAWGLLKAVGLEEKAGEVIANLPHGEQRLLDIAVTMATSAELLLLDEPLAGLADVDRERIGALIRRLAGHYTIFLIEHDIDRVISLSDRITVLHQGRLIADGDPDAVVSNAEVVKAYLGETSEAAAAVPVARQPAAADRAPVLSLRNVDSGYDGSSVLDGLSLEVREGEAVALLGRNGVGKTTTLYTIMGLLAASKGQLHFKGSEITGQAPNQINRQGIAIVPQGRRVFPNLSILDNLLIARRPGGWSPDQVFELFPKLGTLQSSLGGNLSGGEQQMLAIARALMAPADLILLDEPFEGLAPAIVTEVLEAVIQLRERASILLVEQRIDLALQVVDRAYIMVNGRVAYEGTAGDLQQNKALQVKLLGV
ncbi:branched-chain amino acid ABC transporter ATP-binding protein/permease [Bordetella petrii]|uniref:branched-chain amino acid ABC transporter ATP-binding protein/permease n=1 Tax=Bordetella petrii TaxID=94624 RepID=UPI001A95D2BE|nr:branched-chain amino acid ABC transporter ATP-binding protein/permease [Bordetella petrii]MBO1110618.1 ATP-binding cassette domain-containing protein [Bordetella petrii]